MPAEPMPDGDIALVARSCSDFRRGANGFQSIGVAGSRSVFVFRLNNEAGIVCPGIRQQAP